MSNLLIKQEKIDASFIEIKKKFDRFDKLVMSIKVTDVDSMNTADGNLKDVMDMIKKAEAIKNDLKGPYLETTKAIDKAYKFINSNLENYKAVIKKHIITFKNLEKARMELEAEAERIKIAEESKVKEEVLNELSRIAQMMNSKVFGGLYYTKSGEEKSSPGLRSSQACDELIDEIRTKFPDSSNYTPLEDIANQLKVDVQDDILHLKEVVTFMNEDTDEFNKAYSILAQKSINRINETFHKSFTRLDKETKKANKTIDNEIHSVAKGLRGTIKFIVEDISKVPSEYLMVDPTKINEFKVAAKEKVMADMKEGNVTIPGIKFYYDQTVI